MNLPRRRRSRPKGRARLALAGDFPDTGESVTEILDRVRPAGYDGRTYWGGGLPEGITVVAVKQAGQDTEPLGWHRSQPRYRPPAPAAPEPPAPRPPAIFPLPPELPPHTGLPAAQVTAMLGAIRYPGTGGTPEDYAAVMRRWSHLTGTASGLESPGAWPRHALEAMAS